MSRKDYSDLNINLYVQIIFEGVTIKGNETIYNCQAMFSNGNDLRYFDKNAQFFYNSSTSLYYDPVLFEPLSGQPLLVGGKQAKPDLLDLEDISPGRKLRSLVNSSKFLIRLFSPDYETRISGVKKCGDPPFMTEAMSSLEDISNDPKEDEKIRWTANESMALINFGQKN